MFIIFFIILLFCIAGALEGDNTPERYSSDDDDDYNPDDE